MKSVIVNCDNYNIDIVTTAVNQLFDDLGGIKNFIAENQNVLIKANLVRDMSPDKAATTHPAVIETLAKKILTEAKANSVTVADSSGGAYNKTYMSNVYRVTQMDVACLNSGAVLNEDFTFSTVHTDGKVLKNFDCINAFVNADVVINVGKLKTHSFTGFSGAAKNLFGIIPGLVKVELHSKFADLDSFCNCIIDIEQFATKKVCLHIIDGIVGMDGEGPTNGKPIKLGKLIASTDAYMCDTLAISLFTDPNEIPLIKMAILRGVLSKDYRTENGFDFSVIQQNEKFKKMVVLSNFFVSGLPDFLKKLFRNNMTKRAHIKNKICRGCGKCATHCPAKAITIKNHKAAINQQTCIRCYCCQELCPFDAVKFKKPIIYRVIRKFSSSKIKKNSSK